VRSLIQRIQQHIQAEAGGVFLGIAAAADGFVAFQRATDVVGLEDDGPAAVDRLLPSSRGSMQSQSVYAHSIKLR
jgi:hypothetical protein